MKFDVRNGVKSRAFGAVGTLGVAASAATRAEFLRANLCMVEEEGEEKGTEWCREGRCFLTETEPDFSLEARRSLIFYSFYGGTNSQGIGKFYRVFTYSQHPSPAWPAY